jgi:hypothetical protein
VSEQKSLQSVIASTGRKGAPASCSADSGSKVGFSVGTKSSAKRRATSEAVSKPEMAAISELEVE